MYTFPNISKPRFGKDRSATPSQPEKVALAITLEHSDNLSVPKTFATEDEVGGYVSMEMPESTAFDAVSITLEGSHPTYLCHHLSNPDLELVLDEALTRGYRNSHNVREAVLAVTGGQSSRPDEVTNVPYLERAR